MVKQTGAVKQLLILMILALAGTSAQERVIDYRYAPPHYHTPIGFVDDWQKTLVNEQGALLYDFGPGPYVRPNTIVHIEVKHAKLGVDDQKLEDARVPIVMTHRSADGVRMKTDVFAVVPREVHTRSTRQQSPRVNRLLGLNGAIAWADPGENVDPAFRNVAWGTNRPIVYTIGVPAGSKKKVALGICESYRTTAALRAMEFRVEGSEVLTVDPLLYGVRNQPLVFFFDGEDLDRDGELRIEARPTTQAKDPNVILNGIWIFSPPTVVTAEEVISGAARKRAEVFVDCGMEPQVQQRPTRIDAVLASIEGDTAIPVISVQSLRHLVYDTKSGTLKFEGRPFVTSRPKPVSAHRTGRGWELELPRGTRKAEVIVVHGFRLPDNIARVPDLPQERQRSIAWWKSENRIPYDRVHLPDSEWQHLYESGLRNLYQHREVVDGNTQFQPGSTVYRGLWIHDGAHFMESVAILGDIMSARKVTENLFSYQDETGKVQVMFPVGMQRETPVFIWTLGRYARLANRPQWARANWERIVAAMDYLRSLRKATMSDSGSPYYGLLPPGFVDGGIADLTADYSAVFWSLFGIQEAIEIARWIGKTREAEEWKGFYKEFLYSFREAARRDQRRDQYGNLYLPVRVGDTTSTDTPQRAQWAMCEALFMSELFPPGDPLAAGTLAAIDSSCVQGLPTSFGWLTGGIGVWFSPLYAIAHVAQGNVEKGIDILYAFGNHATPHGAWAEEQMPNGMPPRTVGDFPTTCATGAMVRSVLYLFVSERGDGVELLSGMPAQWLTPGSRSGVKSLITTFGPVSVEVSVAEGGDRATIFIASGKEGERDASMSQYTDTMHKVGLRLKAFRKAGFVHADGSELADVLPLAWGKKTHVELRKR